MNDSHTCVKSLLNLAKSSLVDLGLRNRMINLTPAGKGRSIDLDADPDQLARGLADGTPFFIGKTGISPVKSDPRSPAEQRKAFLSLANDAAEIDSEQGISSLRIVIGTVEWRDEENKVRHAPLVTIPITIARTRTGQPLAFRATGKPETNDAIIGLAARKGFHIDIDPVAPMASVITPFEQNATGSNSRTAISPKLTPRVTITLFNGSYLAMSQAIDPRTRPRLAEAGALRQLAGDPSAIVERTATETENIHAVPADASQNAAVTQALQSTPLIIQGPPGTGKSQTIINLAINAVRLNRRVLICAEKVAALEVIHRRLSAANNQIVPPTLPGPHSLPVSPDDRIVLATPQLAAAKIPLESQDDRFDLLIIDEGSQMPLSHAIVPATMAREICVIGDPQQMPPAETFKKSTTSGTATPQSSILDHAMAMRWNIKTLVQHYRSRTPDIIAYSNSTFYESRLETSPTRWRQAGLGIHVRPVRGAVYQRATTRTNAAEAHAITRTLIPLARHQAALPPEQRLSVGVVTMNAPQRDLIFQILGDALIREQLHASTLSGTGEPLFIKSIENIQGDERDFIVVSLTYGPDSNGRILRNFGPLTAPGSEKRLNVLVTRARRKTSFFLSISPEDLPDNETGAGHLRRYLTSPANTIQAPSPFANHLVHEYLRSEGAVSGSHGRTIMAGLPDMPDRWLLALNIASPRSPLDTSANEQRLQSLGWQFLTVQESELDDDPLSVARSIMKRIQSLAIAG